MEFLKNYFLHKPPRTLTPDILLAGPRQLSRELRNLFDFLVAFFTRFHVQIKPAGTYYSESFVEQFNPLLRFCIEQKAKVWQSKEAGTKI